MFFAQNEISFELLGVFKIKRGEFQLKSAVKRSYDSISLRLEGRGYFKTESRDLTVKKGDLLYSPKTAVYSQKTAGETLIAIHFINYTFVKGSRMEILSVEDAEYVEDILQWMYDIWKEKKQGYRHRCCALFYELLYFCNRQAHEKRTGNEPMELQIKKAADYIHGHFRTEQIEVAALAKMCAVSETYFRKLFQRYYAVSPKRYIIDLKLETAAQLLQSQLYTVTEVCERSGFTDPKYFARLFRSRFGCTPRQYIQKDIEP